MMPLNRNLLFNHPEQIIGVLHYGLPTDDVKLRLVPYHYKGKGLEDFPLGGHLVLSGVKEGSASMGGQRSLHPLKKPRKDVVAYVGGHHHNGAVGKSLFPGGLPEAGTAALAAGDKLFFLQHGKRPADGLATALEPLAKLLLGGEHLAVAVLAVGDFQTQGICKEAVFGGHGVVLLRNKVGCVMV